MFKLDRLSSKGSVAQAAMLLSIIGQQHEGLQYDIEETWRQVALHRGEEPRERAAWAAVRKFNALQVEAMIEQVQNMCTLVRTHATGHALKIVLAVEMELEGLRERLKATKAETLSDFNANAELKRLVMELKQAIRKCVEALDQPEAAEAKRLWQRQIEEAEAS